MIKIEVEQVKPYLSILVASCDGKSQLIESHNSIADILKIESGVDDASFSEANFIEVSNETYCYLSTYRIDKEPSWLKDSEIKDIEHHCIISFQKGKYAAYYFSEKGRKDQIRSFFGHSGYLPNTKPMEIAELYHNFLDEDNVKMLWLNDITGKTTYKAESKVLGGDGVADALDPMSDQSYTLSAARTKTKLGSGEASIGINPFKSSLWRGPCRDWKTFEARINELLDKINTNSGKNNSPISVLAYPISDATNLSDAYDFSLVDPMFLPEDISPTKKDLLENLQEYRIDTSSSFSGPNICLDIFYKGKKVSGLTVEPEIAEFEVSFKVLSTNHVLKEKKRAELFERIFRFPELVKCWYESGHAIVGGMVFQTSYRDVTFNNILWSDFDKYELDKEKPTNNKDVAELSKIGVQKSLFCWIKNFWCGAWLSGNEFEPKEDANGWLYCDDGAQEKADFINLAQCQGHYILTFIHVKSIKKKDNSNRKISVCAHDVVLNQAIKNLRYCDRKKLVDSLQERVDGADKKYCWKDGKKANANDFIKELSNIKAANNIRTRVVVVHPHTKKSVYKQTPDDNNIKRQLNTLLVSTENAVRATNSDFYLIAFDG